MFLTLIYTLRRRRAIPPDLFYAYWVNAHAAQIACRLPGIHDLWLHELSYEAGLRWPRIPGIEFQLAEEDRFDGIPEPTFASKEEFDRFVAAAAPLMDDEANIFEETISYQSPGENSRTFVDRSADRNGGLKFMLFLKARDGNRIPAFREFLTQEWAPCFAAQAQVRKLRLHLFEPYTDDYCGLDARGLSHAKAPDKQYQAMCEIAFDDALELGAFIRSPGWNAMRDVQARQILACHAFGVNATHTLRRNGELTLSGLRTPMIADLIMRIGAVNQLEPAVVDLVLGRQARKKNP